MKKCNENRINILFEKIKIIQNNKNAKFYGLALL